MSLVSCLKSSVAVYTLLFFTLMIHEIIACNRHNKFNKQDRYYRRHNYRRVFGKRSVDDHDRNRAARDANQEADEFLIPNTSCGNALCESALDYPIETIKSAVKQLREISQSSQASFGIDRPVLNFLSERLKSEESSLDFPDIVYEESKGCKSFGNVSFPQEGYSNDDGHIYYIVNVPDLQQKANGSTCKKSKKECGGDIELPATYSRTCQQVYRDEEFLVLPSNRSQYHADDFRIRTFLVPDGCKCVLLHTGDYEFMKNN